MIYDIYTNNATCPYCIKAKELLDARGLNYAYHVVPKSTIEAKFPFATTVPQIVHNKVVIGGFEELKESLNTRTVFNKHNKGHETGEYKLFFGESLGFVDTINTPYPILDELYQQQVSQLWNELEIDLTQDRQDMLSVPKEKTDLMVLNLLWQTLVDSIANRSINSLLLEFVTNSDLEAWYNVTAFFETIHARTYSHIIKQTFTDPNEGLRKGYENKHIIARAQPIIDAFDNLADIPKDASMHDKKDAVYLAVVALYLLESVAFMASFAVTFGIAETGVFSGISQDVTLICRDEMLHFQGGKEILKIQLKEDPHLANMRPQIQELFDSILKAELEWTDYLFSEGRQCIGITAPLIKEYIHYLANPATELLGLKPLDNVPTDIPLHYMNDYMDSSRVQVAAQELQLTSYLVNAVTAVTETELDNLLGEYR